MLREPLSYLLTQVVRIGQVEFEGKAYVCAKGARVAQADSSQARKLIHDIDAARIMDLQWPSGSWLTDAPDATLRLSIGKRSKQLWHYLGDMEAPWMLRDIEKEIDEIAGVARWLPQRDGNELFCVMPDGTREALTDD